MSSDKLSNGF